MDYRRDHDLGLPFPVYGAAAGGSSGSRTARGLSTSPTRAGLKRKKGTTGGDDQAPVPRPAFQGPGNKLDKMRILGIHSPDEKRAESPKTPVSEAKTTPTREENH